MRIEKLQVSGLRSHRGNPPTSLDLTGKRLVAVVGHTGAGKSSLLEAITFALFGEATYGGRAYEELSSDGRTEMSVQLTFTRGSERYQLLRTVAPDRNGKFGNKVVYLRQVDEEGNVLSHTERVRDVDKAVSALLGGMTREQFCQAVLLAQNRFAALLEASAADRDRLLDTLLGLNALSDARSALLKTRSAAGRNIERLEYRRANLPAHPAAEANAAKARAKAMSSIAQRADDCSTELATLADQAAGLSQQVAVLERAAELRTTVRGPSGLDRLAELERSLERLASLEDDLSGAERNAAAVLQKAQRGLEQSTETLADTEALHGASGRHQVVAQQLDTLAHLLEEKPGRDQAIKEAEADVRRMEVEKTAAQKNAVKAGAETQRRDEACTEAQDSARQAGTATERAEQAVSSVISASGRLAEQIDTVDQALEYLHTAQAQVAEADQALVPAANLQEEAEQALQAAIRLNSAAAASHGCEPGDDCPVCGRALPQSWAAPGGVDLDAAHLKATNADTALRTATNRQRRASETHVRARTQLWSELGAVVAIYKDLCTLATDQGLEPPPTLASALLPHEDESDGALGPALEASRDLVETLEDWLESLDRGLRPIQQAKERADTLLKDASDQLEGAEAAESAARESLGRASTELATAETRHSSAVEALESCDRRLASTLSGTDIRWRVLVDLGAPDSLQIARQTLSDDQTAVDVAAQRCHQAEGAVRTHEKAIQGLAARRAKELTAPLAEARTSLRTLTELVDDLCGRLDLAPAAAVAQEAGAERVARHCGGARERRQWRRQRRVRSVHRTPADGRSARGAGERGGLRSRRPHG